MWTPGQIGAWIEPCAGSAAVGLRLLGTRPPVAYVGGKTAFADTILTTLGTYPGAGCQRLGLVDPGWWGRAWPTLRHPGLRGNVVLRLREWLEWDEAALWAWLKREGPPVGDANYTAAALVLSLWSYERGARLWAPGWETCWYGGYVRERRPSLQSLIRRVEDLDRSAFATCFFRGGQGGAERIEPGTVFAEQLRDRLYGARVVVYLDPPYAGTTGYSHELPREDTVGLALDWHETGANVAVSETEPVEALVAQGWRAVELHAPSETRRSLGAWGKGGENRNPETGTTTEWLTLSPASGQDDKHSPGPPSVPGR
tara:strand:+ start:1663 stop:2604 length:942 start_codon:yes stop_codon:yes gene_type:complete